MSVLSLAERVELLGGAVTARQLVAGELPWLTPELIDTEAARERLRAWAAAGGLTRPRRSMGEIGKALRYYGDDQVWLAVVAALDRVPPPVAEFLVDTAAVLGIGWAMRGCTFLHPLDLGARRVILVAGGSQCADEVVHTTLHEVAHAWLEADPGPADEDFIPSAFEHARAVVQARRHGLEAAVKREVLAQENRVHNLIRRWGSA